MSVKIQQLFVLFIFLSSTITFSQRAKSESVNSVFFAIPSYDLNTSASKLTYSFAMGKTNFGKPKSFESEEICVAAGSDNVFKDAKKISVYMYSVPAEINDAYLIVSNTSGDILYAEEYTSFKRSGSLANETTEIIYGDEKCYWHPTVFKPPGKKIKTNGSKNSMKESRHVFLEMLRRVLKRQ